VHIHLRVDTLIDVEVIIISSSSSVVILNIAAARNALHRGQCWKTRPKHGHLWPDYYTTRYMILSYIEYMYNDPAAVMYT